MVNEDNQTKQENRSAPIHSISCSSKGSLVLSASDDGWLEEWSIDSGKLVRSMKASIGGIYVWDGPVKAWFPFKGFFIWGADDHCADGRPYPFLDKEKGNITIQKAPISVYHLPDHSGVVRSLTITKEGDLICIIAASSDGMLRKWNFFNRELLQAILVPDKWRWYANIPGIVELSADGRIAVTIAEGFDPSASLLIWDIQKSEYYYTPDYGLSRITRLAISPDGRYAVTACYEDGIVLWNIEERDQIGFVKGSKGRVSALAIGGFLLNSIPQLMAAAYGSKILVWSLLENKIITSLTLDSTVTALAITPDSQKIIAGEESGRLHFLQLENLKWYSLNTNVT